MTGAQLKQRIVQSGKTQKEIAEAFNMLPSQWTTYFRQQDVKSGIVERTAEYLGMTIAEFYGDHQPDNGKAEEATTTAGLLEIIRTKDLQIEECQQQISRLISLIEVFSNGTNKGQ